MFYWCCFLFPSSDWVVKAIINSQIFAKQVSRSVVRLFKYHLKKIVTKSKRQNSKPSENCKHNRPLDVLVIYTLQAFHTWISLSFSVAYRPMKNSTLFSAFFVLFCFVLQRKSKINKTPIMSKAIKKTFKTIILNNQPLQELRTFFRVGKHITIYRWTKLKPHAFLQQKP